MSDLEQAPTNRCFSISNGMYIAFVDTEKLAKKIKSMPIMKWARIRPCFQVYFEWIQDYIWRRDLPLPYTPDGVDNRHYYEGPSLYEPIPIFNAPLYHHKSN